MLPKLIGSEVEYNVHLTRLPGTANISMAGNANHWLLNLIVEKGGELRGISIPRPPRSIRRWFNWWGITSNRENPTGHAQQVEQRLGMSGWRLTNGARFYRDAFFPEYSTPECLSVKDLVKYEKAGERVLALAMKAIKEDGGIETKVFKKNSDRQGASYGCHENYLLSREFFSNLARPIPWEPVTHIFATFLVTRQIFAGSGKVGSDIAGEPASYQLSQRADFMRTLAASETTHDRPILNLRDSPYADRRRFGRLHVIIGDSNMSETSIFLKMGTTALVLAMLEDGWMPMNLKRYIIRNPLTAVKIISRDLTLKKPIETHLAGNATALEIQTAFLESVCDWYEGKYLAEHEPNPEYEEIVDAWMRALGALGRDPTELATVLDCWAKKKLVEQMLEESGYSLDDVVRNSDASDIALSADYLYHSVDENESHYSALLRDGFIECLIEPRAIEKALTEPPQDTRAYLRSILISYLLDLTNADASIYASWHGVSAVTRRTLWPKSLIRIQMPNPLRGTKLDTDAAFAGAPDLRTLEKRLKEVCDGDSWD